MSVFYLVNYIRSIPMYILVLLTGSKVILESDIEKYRRYVCANTNESFLKVFNKLLLRDRCFRNVVNFRIAPKSKQISYIGRLLFPLKCDLEIHGKIGGGLAIYHGHGTVITPNSIGENFSVYQGVTIGKNITKDRKTDVPTIGNNVTVYANAVVVGGIFIGDNVIVGAGTVVTKDIPSNSVVKGNPCTIIQR